MQSKQWFIIAAVFHFVTAIVSLANGNRNQAFFWSCFGALWLAAGKKK